MLSYFGERFVFHYAEIYRTFAIWSVALLTPLILYRARRIPDFYKKFSKAYPRTWMISLPICIAAFVGVAFAGTLGWFFAASAWYGGAVHHVSATATEVESYSRRKGCDQRATLQLESVDKKACLDGLYPPSAMRTGQALDIGIVRFPYGFLIVSIVAADASTAP